MAMDLKGAPPANSLDDLVTAFALNVTILVRLVLGQGLRNVILAVLIIILAVVLAMNAMILARPVKGHLLHNALLVLIKSI